MKLRLWGWSVIVNSGGMPNKRWMESDIEDHSAWGSLQVPFSPVFSPPFWYPSLDACSSSQALWIMIEMTPVTEKLSQVIKKSKLLSSPLPLDQLIHHPEEAFISASSTSWPIQQGHHAWREMSHPHGRQQLPSRSPRALPKMTYHLQPISTHWSVSKLPSGSLRERWLKYMRLNNYLDSNLLKTFLPTAPGVFEHLVKLPAVIKSGKKAFQPSLGFVLPMPMGAFITPWFSSCWPTTIRVVQLC